MLLGNPRPQRKIQRRANGLCTGRSGSPLWHCGCGSGAGLQGLFHDLGAGQVVSGGQTMNPSTEDILKAIHATPAQTVFVLPNNKNIIMAAEQAIKLADRKVCVLPSRTVPQGIAAMLAFDPDADLEQNQVNMSNALETVSTGSVTLLPVIRIMMATRFTKGNCWHWIMENWPLPIRICPGLVPSWSNK